METKVNYFIVGLFMTVLTMAIIGTAIWIAGGHSAESYRTYLTYLNESVAGLSPKAPVKFNGVEVGYVDTISLNPRNPQQVRLELQITDTIPITEATRATLQTQGITGLMFVGLKAEKISSPPLKKQPGEAYPVIKAAPSLLLRVDQAVQEITTTFKEMFDPQNKQAFKTLLHNLETTSNILSKNSTVLDETIESTRKLMDNSTKASEKFPEMMRKFDETIGHAHDAADDLHRTFKDLSDETLPAAQQVMQHLKDTLINIEQLSDQMTKNPSILIRGKPPAPPGPGEK